MKNQLPTEIKKMRNQIDCLDQELILLIDQRLQLVNKVLKLKKKTMIPLTDLKREKEILQSIEKNKRIKNRRRVLKIYQSIITIGKRLPR